MAYSTPLVLVMVLHDGRKLLVACRHEHRQIVAGREAMDCAKMMGITPDMFTLMGRMRALAAVHLPAAHTAWHTELGIRRSESFTKTITTTRARCQHQDHQHAADALSTACDVGNRMS